MSEDEITKFEEKWKEIYNEGIEKVFRIAETREQGIFDLNQYTRLYTMVYDICVSRSNIIQLKCYERLCEIMKNYCERGYLKIKQNYSQGILVGFVQEWTIFEEVVLKWILKFFSYLVNNLNLNILD